ncbi:MAG: YebC/PmpR family DNA-binding transcriptional regulator [Bacilli bacterium]|nr:YebC/PmpR family DNA-binding transcriptional regulator [Bacilli bacterium]
MGRHFEVRAAAMAASAKAKSAVYMRASKEIYAAAKKGVPDPASNLALRSAIEKYRKSCPKDVIERAIEKAKGGDAMAYIDGSYEFYGPGGSFIIVETLSDNVNRALVGVKTIVTKKGGKMGSVAYNFERAGLIDFAAEESKLEEIQESLIMADVDFSDASWEDDIIEIKTAPESFEAAKAALNELGYSDFERAEITLVPNDWVDLDESDCQKMRDMLAMLDENEDVQNVYHNVGNI